MALISETALNLEGNKINKGEGHGNRGSGQTTGCLLYNRVRK